MMGLEESVCGSTTADQVDTGGLAGTQFHVSQKRTFSKDFGSPASTERNYFAKRVTYSPDGLCLLTSCEDGALRVFETLPRSSLDEEPEQGNTSVLQCMEGGTIYDFLWFPLMDSRDPSTCFFLSTSHEHPIHLWDAYTGQLRASYRAYNHLDEIVAGHSLAINSHANKIFAGFENSVRVFDITQPGRECELRKLTKIRRSKNGQRGIISTIHFNPDHSGIYACGSYDGSCFIYCESTGEELLRMDGGSSGFSSRKGITQVKFSNDGNYLFTSFRRNNEIHCWDIRNTREICMKFERESCTNQRISFDLWSTRYLATGNTSAHVTLFDIHTGDKQQLFPDNSVSQCTDAINSVHFNPLACSSSHGELAITTGTRHFDLPHESMEDDDPEQQLNKTTVYKNRLDIWDISVIDQTAT